MVVEQGRAVPEDEPGPLSRRDGAWGLRLTGIEGADHLLVEAPEWPVVHVEVRLGLPNAYGSPGEGLREGRVTHRFADGGAVEIRRADLTAALTLPAPPTVEAIVHPYMAASVAMFSKWLGREVLHAGSVQVGEGAWGILGERGTGKSSVVAWLERHGFPAVTDDVLALDGMTALAGPRCIDLRRDAARELGAGRDLGMIGGRERWRMSTSSVRRELPVQGWVFLDWGDEVTLTKMRPEEVLRQLPGHLGVNLVPDRHWLLEAASLPAFTFRRPRVWAALDAAHELLAERLTSSA